MLQHRREQPGAHDDIDPPEVHDGEVAPVVHVQARVEVVRPHPEGEARDVEERKAGPRAGGEDEPDNRTLRDRCWIMNRTETGCAL